MNKKIAILIALYEQSSQNILEVIHSISDGLSKRRQLELLQQAQTIVAEAQGESSELILDIIEAAYKLGSSETVEELKVQGVRNVQGNFSTAIHREAVQNITDDMFYTILEATDHMTADVKGRLEEITRRANQRSLIEGQTRREATALAVAEATERGITGIITANGARVPVDKYLAGTIQYFQRKAHVDGAINRMTENGQDLLYVNSVGITCSICAQYQGRVYSISGNDRRFPRLDRRPPYHGHCVHSAYPWNEEYQTAADVSEMLITSNRPFVDNRSEANIKKYEEMQLTTSRKNETRKQWMRYKSRMPDLPDLKTFASHKARNTQKFRDWQEDFRRFGTMI
ncbi:phage minor capsid protein [Planomicrobium sp. MB-3u-38]|uniref:phage minor capsid protein n=1 Tax=Planomicrobium sp. MB-3u-38 TaxID=2058318 RepID=UPI000C7B42A5|nr:phage minor capsid protein [Planomicrobium sp. MB-3u-38]PKH09853.1 minor capsid protein [Planomicrobium sp. MB-3u-38]